MHLIIKFPAMKISIVNLMMCFLLLFSCGKKEVENKNIKVGISVGPNQERWDKDRDFLRHYLELQNVDVYVKEAMGDEKQQAGQVKELVDENEIDVLIIIPVNSETAGRMVGYAKANDVKVIAYDRIVRNCDLDFYISFDNVRVGEIQAEYLTKIKPEGKYALLGGDANDNNSALLKIGQMNILQPYILKGDIEIVLDQNVKNWDGDNAYTIVNNFLNNNELDAIIASSDALSEGVARALTDHQLTGKILLSGQDAETSACRRIVEGRQTMTVYKVIESLASSTANIAISFAKNEEISNPQMTINNGNKMVPALLLSSVMPVAKENLRMTVIADGYIDENAVFKPVRNN